MNAITLLAFAVIADAVIGGSSGSGNVRAAIEYTSVDRYGQVTTVSLSSGDPYYGHDYFYYDDRHYYEYPPTYLVVTPYRPWNWHYEDVRYHRYDDRRWVTVECEDRDDDRYYYEPKERYVLDCRDDDVVYFRDVYRGPSYETLYAYSSPADADYAYRTSPDYYPQDGKSGWTDRGDLRISEAELNRERYARQQNLEADRRRESQNRYIANDGKRTETAVRRQVERPSVSPSVRDREADARNAQRQIEQRRNDATRQQVERQRKAESARNREADAKRQVANARRQSEQRRSSEGRGKAEVERGRQQLDRQRSAMDQRRRESDARRTEMERGRQMEQRRRVEADRQRGQVDRRAETGKGRSGPEMSPRGRPVRESGSSQRRPEPSGKGREGQVDRTRSSQGQENRGQSGRSSGGGKSGGNGKSGGRRG